MTVHRQTSERHTRILNDHLEGTSPFRKWVTEGLGDIALLDWSWGQVHLRWTLDDRYIMPDGVMFGGHIAAVADHVTSLGALTVLTMNEERFRTSRLETNFFRPLTKPHADIHVRLGRPSR